MLWRLFSSISLMRSACVMRTRFILNNVSGIGLGGIPGPPGSPESYPSTNRARRIVTSLTLPLRQTAKWIAVHRCSDPPPAHLWGPAAAAAVAVRG